MKCTVCLCEIAAYEDCPYHQDCARCEGSGSIQVRKARTYNPDTAHDEEWEECPDCKGEGWVTA